MLLEPLRELFEDEGPRIGLGVRILGEVTQAGCGGKVNYTYDARPRTPEAR
jgi:GMP synthase PP-ATPase subunit